MPNDNRPCHRYLEPSALIRTAYLYNSLKSTAAGSVAEELSGLTWESFVRKRIFDALGMTRSTLDLHGIRTPARAFPLRSIRCAGR
ncbi:MAG: hypothetical protein U0Q12_12810 [Vicinamibacterales bacterium]